MPDASALIAAAAAGDLARVREILADAPSLIGERDGEGATALHHAALHGRQDVVRFLIAQGADANARDGRFGATPAGWAIEYLREQGGCLAMEIEDVLLAIRQGDVWWLRRFLDRTPALARCADGEGAPLSRHAAASGNPDIRRLFEEATRCRS
jgi:ankyrin repeat protein